MPPALAPKHCTLLRMPIAPNMSIQRMPATVLRASIQTAVPQPNDSLNYQHLLSHSSRTQTDVEIVTAEPRRTPKVGIS